MALAVGSAVRQCPGNLSHCCQTVGNQPEISCGYYTKPYRSGRGSIKRLFVAHSWGFRGLLSYTGNFCCQLAQKMPKNLERYTASKLYWRKIQQFKFVCPPHNRQWTLPTSKTHISFANNSPVECWRWTFKWNWDFWLIWWLIVEFYFKKCWDSEK